MLFRSYSAAGHDGIFSRITESASEISSNENFIVRIVTGFEIFLKFLGWVQIPIFIFAVPIGIIVLFKKIDTYKSFIMSGVILLSLPAIYGYSSNAYDTRYLYFQYVFFCGIFSLGIKRLLDFQKRKNFFLFLLCIGIVIASFIFLDLKINNQHQMEAFKVSKAVLEKTNGINSYYPESSFLKAGQVSSKWPFLSSQMNFNFKVKDIQIGRAHV